MQWWMRLARHFQLEPLLIRTDVCGKWWLFLTTKWLPIKVIYLNVLDWFWMLYVNFTPSPFSLQKILVWQTAYIKVYITRRHSYESYSPLSWVRKQVLANEDLWFFKFQVQKQLLCFLNHIVSKKMSVNSLWELECSGCVVWPTGQNFASIFFTQWRLNLRLCRETQRNESSRSQVQGNS